MLKKPKITTGILRSKYNKDKLLKKYLNQKIFKISKVHEIFKRKINITEKLLRTPKLITSSRIKEHGQK